jgi:hypothetical protein
MGRSWIVWIVVMAAACGSKDEAKARAAQAQRELEARRGQAERELAAKTAAVERKLDQVITASRDQVQVAEALALGRRVKAELDKVYPTSTDVTLDVTAAGASVEHAANLAALPHVTIGGLTVGYEEVASVSVTGIGRSRHFRAVWRHGDRDVIVGYQSSEELDLVAFAKLLDKLVPVVERVISQ